jgi:nucleoside-diphosphate-sugar epimerase
VRGENNKVKTCLVTGGAGFIGSWLCESLLLERYRVICVDDFSSGVAKNIENFKENENFEFVQHSVIQPLEINKKIDFIFHLASRASPIDYQSHPIHTLLTNAQGTYNLLELTRNTNAKFLFSSTSEVYGDPLEHPQKETYWGNVNPIGLRSCYDESKRFGEAMTMAFLRKYSLDVRIVRIFNTYGPRMKANDGRVVSNFITQALEEKPLTIYGDGKQTRSFCYISDMVEGIKRAMLLKNTKGEVINLGNPNEFTILELANLVKRLTHSNSKIVFKELPEDDPKQRKPDIEKARKILQWEPTINFKEGLKETIQYFKEELKV